VPLPLTPQGGVLLWIAGRIEGWGWDYVARGYNLTVWGSVKQEEEGWWALSAGAEVRTLALRAALVEGNSVLMPQRASHGGSVARVCVEPRTVTCVLCKTRVPLCDTCALCR